MFYVYALRSIHRNYTYVGLTNNVDRRVLQHNNKRERTTRAYAQFTILYVETCVTRVEARQREKYLKSGIGKEFLKGLL